MKYLTKSAFKVALECPSKLYYYGRKKEYPNTLNENEFMAALAEGGFQVGALAKCYYPDGYDIETLHYDEALQKTNALLEKENVVIYEAAVRYENFFIRIDILKKSGNDLELIEVKAKSFHPAEDSFLNKSAYIESKWLPYLQDVAFQTWVTEQAFPQFNITPYLMLADKSKTATVDDLNQRFKVYKDADDRLRVKINGDVSPSALGEPLLTKQAVRPYVNRILAGSDIPDKKKKQDREWNKDFIDRAREYADYYLKDEQYPVTIAAKCKNCEYNIAPQNLKEGQKSGFRECWSKALGWSEDDFAKPHIFDIWNFRQTQNLIDQNIFLLEDIDIETVFMTKKKGASKYKGDVSARQALQIHKALHPQEEAEDVDEALFSRMSGWRFPLHFIDFETSMVAIPFNKGRRPYEQIAFQFSCHTLYEDGRFEHHEWIAREVGKFPNFDFVIALKELLEQDNGTIFRYAQHENTVLRQIQQQLMDAQEDKPDNVAELIQWIDTVTEWKEEVIENGRKKEVSHAGPRNMVDMLELVKRYYYHRAIGGSNSIKAVLPAVMQASSFLKEKYSRPYNSQNYKDWIWWRTDENTGQPYDPYQLLPPLFEDIDISADELVSENDHIKEGAAAMTAYAKMQFSEMTEQERQSITKGLLKYCELDTLAMVMVYEHWKSLAGDRLSKGK